MLSFYQNACTTIFYNYSNASVKFAFEISLATCHVLYFILADIYFLHLQYCRVLVAGLGLDVVAAVALALARPLLPWSEVALSLDMMFLFA
jgi:hypothetical protein